MNLNKLENINANFWITANAGSGKTTQLVNRFISLLTSGIKVDEIICITYTEAGAKEMKERIIKKAEEKNIHIEPWQLKISTIHSFCQRLLIKNCFLSQDTQILNDDEYTAEKINKKIIDNLDNKSLFLQKEFESIIKDLADNESIVAFQSMVDEIINRQISFLSLFTNICNNKDAITTKDIIDNVDVNKIKLLLPFDLQKFFGYSVKLHQQGIFLKNELSKYEKDKLLEIIEDEKIFNQKSWKIFEKFLNGEKDIKKLKNWEDIVLTTEGSARKAAEKCSFGLVQCILEYYVMSKKQKSINETIAVLYFAYLVLKEYQDIKFQMNVINYDDLLLETLQLLKTNRLFNEKIEKNGSNIKYLMLDEAQDTNPISWQIINFIIDITKCKFFVVGDKKQSIYRFQGAKVEEYEKNEEIFKNISKQQNIEFINDIILNTSYRSIPEILNYVDEICNEPQNKIAFTGNEKEIIKHNSDIKTLQQQPNNYVLEKEKSIIFEKIDVEKTDEIIKQENEDKEQEWLENTKNLLTKQEERKALAEKYADKIAKYILLNQEERQSGLFNNIEKNGKKINDIAIIYGKGTTQNYFIFDIVKELEGKYNFNISMDSKFTKQNIYTQDIIAFFNFAILQNDNFNLACLLKSEFFNFDDNLLYEIITNGKDLRGDFTLWQKLNYQISTNYEHNKKIKYSVDVLKNILSCENIENIIKIIEQLVEKNSQYSTSFELIKNFFESHKIEYNYDFRGFVRLLESENLKKLDNNKIKTNVFFSTIHGVKGMEFDSVIIIDVNKFNQKNKDEENTEIKSSSKDKYYFFNNHFWYKKGIKKIHKEDKNFQELLQEIENENNQSILEKLRLKYVAITRARRRVIFI